MADAFEIMAEYAKNMMNACVYLVCDGVGRLKINKQYQGKRNEY